MTYEPIILAMAYQNGYSDQLPLSNLSEGPRHIPYLACLPISLFLGQPR